MMHQMLSSSRIKRKEDPSRKMITIFEKSIETMKRKVEERKTRSYYYKGVKFYALELLEKLKDRCDNGAITDKRELETILKNGCDTWMSYSKSGSTLYANCDIAKRLLTPTELKRCEYGNKDLGNLYLVLQASALNDAFSLIWRIALFE